MNEIVKLYKNAGVEPRYIGCYYNLPCCSNCNKNYNDTISNSCKYQIVKDTYPPFTAEKQLELIKWLASNEMLCRLEDEYSYFERFEECISYIINYLWQDLTEQQQEQIRAILNG